MESYTESLGAMPMLGANGSPFGCSNWGVTNFDKEARLYSPIFVATKYVNSNCNVGEKTVGRGEVTADKHYLVQLHAVRISSSGMILPVLLFTYLTYVPTLPGLPDRASQRFPPWTLAAKFCL
jgi:hypothetical protein